jgi:hypothetical protein
MKHSLLTPMTLIAALSLGLCTWSHAASRPGAAVRPFVSMGITGGGDQLGSFSYSNGTDASVHAGGVVHFLGGVDVAFPDGPMSMQVNLGYHFDTANASNGSYSFERMPLEVLGHVALSRNVRLGGGLRWALDPHISSSGVLSGNDASFNTRTALVLEGEYFPLKRLGIKLRAVHETFAGTGSNRGRDVDASHVGAYVAYYFN